MRGFPSIFVISFLFLSVFAESVKAGDDCRHRLTTLSALTTIVERNLSVLQQTKQLILPSFNDFQREIEASKTWEGVRAPRMIQELLPDGVRLIDHSLISANEPGLVKDHGSGEFVSIRASAQGIGTNMGILRQSLVDNTKRRKMVHQIDHYVMSCSASSTSMAKQNHRLCVFSHKTLLRALAVVDQTLTQDSHIGSDALS